MKCPGLCEALPSCQSCTQHGKRYSDKKSVSKVIDILRLNECSWCSHLQECQPKHANPDLCRNNHHPHSDGVWWSKNVRKIGNYYKCQTDDFMPGLTLLKYYSPSNFDYPDEVSITNISKASVQPTNSQG